jgi:ATP-dependent exoDNAse (exonuclease V) beta subunit
MLSKINNHERDKNITFQEEGHIYEIKNGNSVFNPMSVTTIIHKFFPEFNADLIIDKMFKSNRLADKYKGKTKEEIKKEWEENGRIASELGTKMHADIERFLNKEEVLNENTTEFKFFMNFWNSFIEQYPNCKPYRTEWLVYDEDRKIAGYIDCSLEADNGDIILIDWKRSKEIKCENRYEKGFFPFETLDNCNFNHYMLQLNIYRHILETKYNKKIIYMMLVILHPNNQNYNCIPIPKYNIKDIWTQITEHKNK